MSFLRRWLRATSRPVDDTAVSVEDLDAVEDVDGSEIVEFLGRELRRNYGSRDELAVYIGRSRRRRRGQRPWDGRPGLERARAAVLRTGTYPSVAMDAVLGPDAKRASRADYWTVEPLPLRQAHP